MGGLAKGFLQSSLAFCPPRTIIEQVLPFLLWSFMEFLTLLVSSYLLARVLIAAVVPTPEVKGGRCNICYVGK
ncbi:hypothetical protein ES332_A05G278900v1 [Gossypium tomentosum]|uniref:Uncharacterized protein n=1 Tax=Gossypium tomentosum TaxID=34277 RepID=A0A5D2QNI8_GOSTO|nr:hypothetical protein ES332_A05G278900v1 [Gossypium tomentosum]